jgi:hypothetical protein
VSEPSVPASDPFFVEQAKSLYSFRYARYDNFSSVEGSDFLAIVLNGSESNYASLVSPPLGGETISAAYAAGGDTLFLRNLWTKNQTVFVLAGYSGNSLADALNRFFVVPKPVLPEPVALRVSLNSTAKGTGGSQGSDPPISAFYGNYNLTDLSPGNWWNSGNYAPYKYLLNFTNIISYMPQGQDNSIDRQFTGWNLPNSSSVCTPPANGKINYCFGELIGMPVVQFGSQGPQTPVYHLQNGDCSAGPIACVDVMGLTLSGCNNKQFCSALLSLFDLPDVINVTNDWDIKKTATVINLTSTFLLDNYSKANALSADLYLPLPALPSVVFPFSADINTMMGEGVQMYSAPTGICEVLSGGGPCLPGTCFFGAEACLVNYTMWALTTSTSNVPGLDQVLLPQTGYSPLFEPLTFAAPPTFENSTGVYSFSYWDVATEINGTTYDQTFTAPAVTIPVGGPVQAKAIYTQTALSGTVAGRVVFLFWDYHNSSLVWGPPIAGANITISDEKGRVLFNTISGPDGTYATPSLEPGCYNVTAVEYGFNLQPAFNPQCVDGPVDDPIFQWSNYFGYIAESSTGLGSVVLPGGQQGGVNFLLTYPEGEPAANVVVTATTNSGTLTGDILSGSLAESRTGSNGAAYFRWTAGSTPGTYQINFNTAIDGNTLFYTLPVGVMKFDFALQNSSVTVFQGSNSLIPASAGYAGNLSGSLFLPPVNATLSAMRVPTNASVLFTPNPLVGPWYANLRYDPLRPNSVLLLKVGSNTPPGNYSVSLSSTFSSSWFNSPVTNSTILSLRVIACASQFAEVTGEVLNPDGNPTPANVTIYAHSGKVDYTVNTTSGFFNTGYTLIPGMYNVTAYLPFFPGHPYFSEVVTASMCSSTSVLLTPRGALDLQVLYKGSPAPNAVVSLTYPGGLVRNFTTNSQGVFSTPYSLQPGNYSAMGYVGNYSAKSSFMINSAQTTTVSINVLDPPGPSQSTLGGAPPSAIALLLWPARRDSKKPAPRPPTSRPQLKTNSAPYDLRNSR